MASSDPISVAVFSAFLNCPTKGHLLSISEPAPGAFFVDIEARVSSNYKVVAKRQLRIRGEVAEFIDFEQRSRNLNGETINVDCETAVYDGVPQHRPVGHQPQEPFPTGTFVPVLFSPWNKPSRSDGLLVCFGALALLQATGTLPNTGILIYGNDHRHKTVRIGDHLAQTRRTIEAIAATGPGRQPPPLLLNKHCAVCDFQPRCRGLAIEREELSLLNAMTSKERAKCNAKGISTITQLSYCYRPRRRKRTGPDAERSAAKRAAPLARHDHKLRRSLSRRARSMSSASRR